MRRYRAIESNVSPVRLQDAIDASDLIGRWEYDVRNDRVYADALVALVLNIDPAQAATGISIATILAGIHPEDRERTASQFRRNVETGCRSTFAYRVRSADGIVRRVLDRGCIGLDASGRPAHGSGVLVDITHMGCDGRDAGLETDRTDRHPVERAADHCLAARKAIHELPEPLLHRMSDMLVLEVGRMLSKLAAERPIGDMH